MTRSMGTARCGGRERRRPSSLVTASTIDCATSLARRGCTAGNTGTCFATTCPRTLCGTCVRTGGLCTRLLPRRCPCRCRALARLAASPLGRRREPASPAAPGRRRSDPRGVGARLLEWNLDVTSQRDILRLWYSRWEGGSPPRGAASVSRLRPLLSPLPEMRARPNARGARTPRDDARRTESGSDDTGDREGSPSPKTNPLSRPDTPRGVAGATTRAARNEAAFDVTVRLLHFSNQQKIEAPMPNVRQ